MTKDSNRQPLALSKRLRTPGAALASQSIEVLILAIVMTTIFLAGIDAFDRAQRKCKALAAFYLLPQLRMQIMLHHDLYGVWPDGKESLEAIELEKKSGFQPSAWQPQRFMSLLDSYQSRGAFSKEEIDIEPRQSVARAKKPAPQSLEDSDIDYMVVDGSITFHLKDTQEPHQPISLLSFRPASSQDTNPPSFFWSCGREIIANQHKTQGPNHTNIANENLLSICRSYEGLQAFGRRIISR
jgi:hypothetical protein